MLAVAAKRAITYCLWGMGLVVAGCGGGGGGGGSGPTTPGPPPPPLDQLGSTGQIAGTQTIASGVPNWDPAVTLDDSGRALVVWSNASRYVLDSTRVGEPTTYYWTRSDINGNWQTPVELTGSQSVEPFPRLRSNGDGHAVMFTFTGRWRRFDPIDGWAAEQGPPASSLANFGRKEPLQDDGTLPIIVIEDLVASPNRTSVARVLTNNDAQTWNTRFTSETAATLYDVAVASSNEIIGPMTHAYWIESGPSSPGYRLKHVVLNLNGTFTSLTRILLERAEQPCLGYVRLNAAASAERNVALWPQPTGLQGCDLEAIRFDNVTHDPTVDRINSSGYIVREQPLLEMDGRGNALIIWSEEVDSNTSTRRIRWSQSLNGGPWSETQPLIVDESAIGVPNAMPTTRFAMNRDGQGAIVLTAVKSSRSYFVRGRFSFASGWSDWQAFAAVSEAVYTDVAINNRGDAIAVYSAPPCTREPLAQGGTTFRACSERKVFAVRF